MVDSKCRPLAFCPSPGNVADVTVGPARLASTAHGGKFLAFKPCDARALRRRLSEGGRLVMWTSKSGASAKPATEVNSWAARLGISTCR
jgi:hypothetical protein